MTAIDFDIARIGYDVSNEQGFMIERSKGGGDYLFLHFLSSVDIKIDGSIVTTERNCCILYTPACPQWFHSPQHRLHHHWFHFTGELVDEVLSRLELPLNSIFYPTDPVFISLHIKEMITEFIHKDLFWKDQLNGLILQFFSQLARDNKHYHRTKANPYQSSILEKFKRIRSIMLSEVEKPWTIRELAVLAGLSESRFSIVYKELFDAAPKEELIKARLEKAKHLLTNTAVTVKRVSELLGYSNEHHFSRQFKAEVGCTPGRFASRWLESYAIQGHTSFP